MLRRYAPRNDERSELQNLEHTDQHRIVGAFRVGADAAFLGPDLVPDRIVGPVGNRLGHPADIDTRQRPDRLAVAFADPTRPGGVRWVAPSRLTQVETVFAMTVHKSQGSEFAHTALAVPPQWNPVLTRELVYTAITRASQWCSIVLAGNNGEAVLDMAVKRRVLRASGLLANV